MNWDLLFSMQKQLDERIKKEHQLEEKNIVPEKVLALLVELGELANETRCFKFWSNKGPNETKEILEEYVDGLHFILSLGIELGFTYEKNESKQPVSSFSLTDKFIQVYEKTLEIQNAKTQQLYTQLVNHFIELGTALGFNEDMIEQAYFQKNEVNHVRQDEGY